MSFFSNWFNRRRCITDDIADVGIPNSNMKKSYAEMVRDSILNGVVEKDLSDSKNFNLISADYINNINDALTCSHAMLMALHGKYLNDFGRLEMFSGTGNYIGLMPYYYGIAENYLAAIIYIFSRIHPAGFKNGYRLNSFIEHNGIKSEILYSRGYNITTKPCGDLIDIDGNNVAFDNNGKFIDLNGFSFFNQDGKLIVIDRFWYENKNGKEVEPHYVTGEFSDIYHICSFLSQSYDIQINFIATFCDVMPLVSTLMIYFKDKVYELYFIIGIVQELVAKFVYSMHLRNYININPMSLKQSNSNINRLMEEILDLGSKY